MKNKINSNDAKAYIIGGGVASLSAATLLIRDGGFSGKNIHIFEIQNVNGGALDASGSSDDGFISRGGRMFEPHFVCTFDVFSSIPSLEDEKISVTEEIYRFNKEVVSDAKCRLLRNGEKVDLSSFGLTISHHLKMLTLVLRAKGKVHERIDEWFPASFFKTNFWLLWATTFSFQPWDNVDELRRYFLRFIHLVPGFKHLKGILRTKYNQYDTMIRPMEKWLKEKGVKFEYNTQVVDIEFDINKDTKTAKTIICIQNGDKNSIPVTKNDYVFATIGSIVGNSTHGTMNTVPPPPSTELDGSWALWKKIAKQHSDFGNPDAFVDNRKQTNWTSFTVTLKDSLFVDLMEKFTGNLSGTGGLITFTDSNWFMSIVIFHQPYFYKKQEEFTTVFWGDGLFPDKIGNFVKKKMYECTGEEILFEALSHLKIEDKQLIIEKANCISTRMPFITSQFQTRSKGDRPQVVPKDATNFAFMGQYCEVPEDVVFTVEYSVRSAAIAVYNLLNLEKKVPPVYQGAHNLLIDLKAFFALVR